MNFPFNVYALGFTTACLVSAVSLPLWRKWCIRVGLVDDPGARKIHSTPIPLAGGLAVFTGLAASLFCGIIAFLMFGGTAPTEALNYGLNRRALQIAAILAGSCGMLLLGFLDDKMELSPLVKFAGQFFIALLVASSGIRLTLFVQSPLFSYLVTILWILTLTNAFNFMDNMNGLCTGLGLISAWLCGWSAALKGQYLVAIISFQTAGALLGFLPHNFPKARAFLGDAGSHLVGFLLSVLAILPHFYSTSGAAPKLAVLTPLFIVFVPLLDLVWVVLIRWKLGKPFYIGDTNHLSHRLVRRGFSKTHAVLLILLLAAFAGAIPFVLFIQ